MRHAFFVVALCAGVAAPLCAQTPAATSLFTARIIDARTERPIAEASILLLGLERTARSDSAGNLRLTQLPAGKHIALVRAVGYDSLLFAIDIAQSDTAEAELMLTPITQQLETVKVAATGGMLAARMAEYEERRKIGLGSFMDSTAFQEVPGTPLADVLTRRFPGPRFRGARCVSLDGMPMVRIDPNLVLPEEIAAVEVHTRASLPSKYGGTNGCGIFVIVWRKMR
ncbi:MAG: carboxypeptidase-like regulatory domain-containing protein [Gemmatimonadaceae bacterium]|nr:carboxypeptidase-like regulatory domain-containing protein [Gemmatimonadaceae bacterium]